jgi:PiT family inorganic phosphate transporter
VAGNIVVAWLLTLPAAAISGAAAYGVAHAIGHSALGPIVVLVAGLAALAVMAARNSRRRVARAVTP